MDDTCNHDKGADVKQMCVSKVPIFNHLGSKEMREIMGKSREMIFKKGDIIYRQGDPLEYLYIVHWRRVKIYHLFDSGKEQLLRVLEPGEFTGELALFTEKGIDSYAEAIEDAEICAIHRNYIQESMKDYPDIPLKILREFSNRIEEIEYLVGQLSSRDVETRTASYLVKLAKEKDTFDIVLPMSRKDLAYYLGTTQETISRRLSNFQTKGWIERVGHRNIKLLNMTALAEAAEDL